MNLLDLARELQVTTRVLADILDICGHPNWTKNHRPSPGLANNLRLWVKSYVPIMTKEDYRHLCHYIPDMMDMNNAIAHIERNPQNVLRVDTPHGSFVDIRSYLRHVSVLRLPVPENVARNIWFNDYLAARRGDQWQFEKQGVDVHVQYVNRGIDPLYLAYALWGW
jgi:hypothetical protein